MADNHQNIQLERVKEITAQLEQGVKEIFTSDRYRAWMTTMSRFHSYSLNNTILIAMQRPDATLVAGYNAWKQMGRQVMKGSKAIRILAPAPYRRQIEVPKLDPLTQQPVFDADGKPVTETREIQQAAFKVVNVFDISSTEGKELPTLGADELTGDVEQFDTFFQALEKSCPVPITFEDIPGSAKGYYSLSEDRIAIQEGMSQIQTVKTVIHEMAHQKMHCPHAPEREAGETTNANSQADRTDTRSKDGSTPDESTQNVSTQEESTQEQISRDTKEVQAESVAFTVCTHYGIDTSDYSFGYIAGWSGDKELPQLKASMDVIRAAASELITGIDGHFKELTAQKEKESIGKTAGKDTEKTAGKDAEKTAGTEKKSGSRSQRDGRQSVLGTLKIKQQECSEIKGADRPLKIHREERVS